ncbi:ABC-type uncharacterized transport system permease subunit [Paraburkholderia graminis]|uniref:ABC-type uncharacterized transport system permease subunit n=1 Tax=Paraburkholderia graminis TaxID=60548 RepID=A0ABD5CQS0_9BURK|nr:ABC-type uncharacterized transport system permease subunit [Paraburkholderia graminis]
MILPYRLEARTTPSRTMQIAVPLIAALLTLAIGFVIFGLVGRDPLQAMHAFFIEPLSSVNGWSELLLKASPLCLIGLGLAIGYRANVWNIGAPKGRCCSAALPRAASRFISIRRAAGGFCR